MDGTVAVFDTTTGAVVGTMEGHYKPVRSLTFLSGELLRDALLRRPY
jgi:WD40 repeat protein